MSNNAERITKLRAEANELEAQDKAFSALKDNEKLAIQLHNVLCGHNHTDGCGWYYEMLPGKIDDWDGSSHDSYLGKANNMLNACKHENLRPEQIFAVVKALRES